MELLYMAIKSKTQMMHSVNAHKPQEHAKDTKEDGHDFSLLPRKGKRIQLES